MKAPRCRVHPRYKGVYRPRMTTCDMCRRIYEYSRVPPLMENVAQAAADLLSANKELLRYARPPLWVSYSTARNYLLSAQQDLTRALGRIDALQIAFEASMNGTSAQNQSIPLGRQSESI